MEYNNNKFAILYHNNTKRWGLFAIYRQYIACIVKYLSSGYIPIIDLASTPNIFNGYNICSKKKILGKFFLISHLDILWKM